MIKANLLRLLGVFGLWLALVTAVVAAEEKISLRDFNMYPSGKQGVLQVNLHLDYQLTDYLRDSLLNGVSLQHEIHFDVIHHSEWWFNKTETLLKISSELKYNALSRHYQVLRKDTNENWNFTNLASALDHLGSLEHFNLPALPKSAYDGNSAIYVEASLEPKLPKLPLNLSGLFSDDHRLVSQGVLWSLTP